MKVNDFRKRKRYLKHQVVPAFQSAGLDKLAYKLETCGEFIKVCKCERCQSLHFKGYTSCKSKFCPLCAKAKSLLWVGRLYPFLRDWIEKGNYVVLANFTLVDSDDLKYNLSLLKDAWRVLTNSDRTFRKEFKSRFLGGVRALEVVLGKNSGKWHPHYHTILLKDRFQKDAFFMMDAWDKSLNIASGNLAAPSKIGSAWLHGIGKKDVDKDNSLLLKSLLECVKYISKFDFSKITSNKLNELVEGLHKFRQISTFGLLHNISDQVDKDFEVMNSDQVIDFVCRACGCNKATVETLYHEDFDRALVYDMVTDESQKEFYNNIEYLRELTEAEAEEYYFKTLRQTSMFEDE